MKNLNLVLVLSSLFILPLNAVDTSKLIAEKGYFPTGGNIGVAPGEIDDESDDTPLDDDNSSDTDDCNQQKQYLFKNGQDPASTCPKGNKGALPQEEAEKGLFPDTSGD